MRAEAQSSSQLPPNSKEKNKENFPKLTDLQSTSQRDPDLGGCQQTGAVMENSLGSQVQWEF